MARIQRKNQKIFGSASGPNEIGVFGSLGAGSPAYTTDVEVAQSLSNYLTGWFSAVLGDNSPAIEDMNALFFICCYQLSYLMQQGVPEWNIDTTYYDGQFASWLGEIYVSLVDTNLANPVTDQTKWKIYNGRVRTTAAVGLITGKDDTVRGDTTAAGFTLTLPAIASIPIGKKFTIKNVGSGGFVLTLQGNAAEVIDGSNTLTLQSALTLESVTIQNNGVSWDII